LEHSNLITYYHRFRTSQFQVQTIAVEALRFAAIFQAISQQGSALITLRWFRLVHNFFKLLISTIAMTLNQWANLTSSPLRRLVTFNNGDMDTGIVNFLITSAVENHVGSKCN